MLLVKYVVKVVVMMNRECRGKWWIYWHLLMIDVVGIWYVELEDHPIVHR